MARRDTNRIFLNTNHDKQFFLAQWDLKTKEEKQEFIAKYIESLTFVKDENYKYGIKLVDIKIKSLYVEKVNRLSEISSSEVPVEFISNDKSVMVNISYPLKESQVKDYLKEMNKTKAIRFHMHPTFNYRLEDMPDEIVFNLDENEEIFKLVPIIKDIDNPESISNKFRLGIVTSVVKTTKGDSKE